MNCTLCNEPRNNPSPLGLCLRCLSELASTYDDILHEHIVIGRVKYVKTKSVIRDIQTDRIIDENITYAEA